MSLRPVSETLCDATSSAARNFGWGRSGGLAAPPGKAVNTKLAKLPSLTSLCNDLRLLIESLVDLEEQLSRSNVESSALATLCATLLPAHKELKDVVSRLTSQGRHANDPLVTGESLELMMLYMQLILQALMDQSKQLKSAGSAHDLPHKVNGLLIVSLISPPPSLPPSLPSFLPLSIPLQPDDNVGVMRDHTETTALADSREILLHMQAQEAELNTLRRLYKATQAGSVATHSFTHHGLQSMLNIILQS